MSTASRIPQWRFFTTRYTPDPTLSTFLSRAQTQENTNAEVTVSVLDAAESASYFGVSLARRGIQPVYIRVVNRSQALMRLRLVQIDPNYYTPLEAAARNHFSFAKRLSAFGLIGWIFLPLLVLIPLKLITAYRANRRMDEFFSEHAFHMRPIPPGSVSEGFVFTSIDAGMKVVPISLHSESDLLGVAALADAKDDVPVDFIFSIPVPGISVDFLSRHLSDLISPSSRKDCDVVALSAHLKEMPAATSNAKQTRNGDPLNLVVIGDFDAMLSAFIARWDESEVITLSTCWKTVRSFLLSSHYRYSPVSALYLFGRSQDIALQRSRKSINERLHLRLWLTPLRYQGESVWLGQVSRDIGVRFTYKTWNLTTHRVDPDVDEARDYVIEDLTQAERVDATSYVDGVGSCSSTAPRRNLTGDPYFTDGKRAVILLSKQRNQLHSATER
ncbi:LssY C-terminal domain-containing protein [Lacipirellula limnantheis]|nr:LssY C-terminal domain-containing protein [Lacipirellula limnantheis]